MNRGKAIRLIAVGAVGAAATFGAYILAVRPWMLRWGATEAELYETLTGDDPVRLHPDAPPLTAVIVEPNQALALMNRVDATASPAYNGTWGFYVREVDSTTTRLLIRSRWNWKSGLLSWFAYRCLLEPAHFIMERKMLLGIKARADRTSA